MRIRGRGVYEQPVIKQTLQAIRGILSRTLQRTVVLVNLCIFGALRGNMNVFVHFLNVSLIIVWNTTNKRE
jgi:hypothetical protein